MTEQTILFVSHSPRLYGAERSMLDLISALPARLCPFVLVPAEGPLTSSLREKDVAYEVVPFREWLSMQPSALKRSYRSLSNLLASLKVMRHLREQPATIYTNTLASPLGGLLAARWKVPHVWHVREYVHNETGFIFDYGMKKSLSFVNRRASKVLFNSHALCRAYAPFLDEDKLEVVYNGFLEALNRAALYRPREDISQKDKVRLCILGSVQENKGQIDAVMALDELLKRGKRVELCVVGDGHKPYQDKLQRLVKRLGISKHVSWLGYRDDAMAIFKEADIALVCSRFEAFGRVIVEAMATGCPVIATNTGGIPEIIEPEVNGLLYQAGDYGALAASISRLIEEPELYKRNSREGAEVAYKRFTKNRYVKEVVGILDGLLPQPAPSALTMSKLER